MPHILSAVLFERKGGGESKRSSIVDMVNHIFCPWHYECYAGSELGLL